MESGTLFQDWGILVVLTGISHPTAFPLPSGQPKFFPVWHGFAEA